MKTKILVSMVLLLSASIVYGIRMARFSGWDDVKMHSPNIIIARCVKTVDDPHINSRSLIYSDIQIVTALKGRTNLESARLGSVIWPRQGEYYLLFSHYMDGQYYAVEQYRVVPLGTYLPPDLLTGKTLDENIQILFQRRLHNLNLQMKDEQEEKQRLEDGLKK